MSVHTGRLTVRPAGADDLEDLVGLENASFVGDYAPHRWEREQFRYYLRHPRALLGVARRGERAEGYVCGLRSAGVREGQVRLYSIAVAPEERRRGTGRALLDWFLAGARRLGARTAILEVSATRDGAQAFFREAGFRDFEKLPDHYGAGDDGLRMRMTLAPADARTAAGEAG